MNGFYVSMIFLGIILVTISLLLIVVDKRKAFGFVKSFDDKKQELTEIINDAEQMIDELNRFSDYIVNQMDLKSEELNKNLKEAEDKVKVLGERIMAVTASSVSSDAAQTAAVNSAFAVNSVPVPVPDAVAAAYGRTDRRPSETVVRKREKVIQINNKYTEVLRLAQEGVESLDIAKRLNMGKGEVELIIGLKR